MINKNKILLIIFALLLLITVAEGTYYFSLKKTSESSGQGDNKSQSSSVQNAASQKSDTVKLIESLNSDLTKSVTLTSEIEGTVESYDLIPAVTTIPGGSDKDIKIVIKSPKGKEDNANIYLNEHMLQRTTFYQMVDGKESSASAEDIKVGKKIDIISTIDALKMDTTSMKIVVLE